MTKLLKDPLVHFLLIGAALFAFSAWRGESIDAGREQIVIGAAQVAQLRDSAALLQGRAPTREELEALIEPSIRDEVLYREALALGLDENDDEVRRRLIEKMQYLTQDLADPEPPSEDALRAFYDAAPERFRVPELVTFEQVFFTPGGRGAAVRSDAESALAALRAGTAERASVGDRTPLRDRYEEAPREQVTVLFGDAIAEALFTTEPGEWQGPYESDFGLHLVRLAARTPSRDPPYEEIRERVLTAYAEQRRQEANAADYQRMRDGYDIVVEWPVTTDAPDAPPRSATPEEASR